MRLWNDYEGATIADAYPIEKLIRPEGRSAFFATSNGTGTPAVIRLIESINDETEILKRWKTVSELHEEHLIQLKKFGQTVFEGTPLIYVLMEKSEADLATILQDRPLTVEETRQIAESLIDALEALHSKGIVHEHVEAANVMAAGEVVKLRSDCIREVPEGAEGVALIQGDVRDLALVLLQALTLRKSLEAIGSTRLPEPFDAMIRNGISGRWGLAQMAAALNPPKPEVVAAKTAPVAAVSAAAATTAAPAASTVPVTKPAAPVASSAAAASTVAPAASKPSKPEQMPLEIPAVAARSVTEKAATNKWRSRRMDVLEDDEDEATMQRRRWWIALAPAAVVILLALIWHVAHKPEGTKLPQPQPITTLSNTGQAQGTTAQGPAPAQAGGPAMTGIPDNTAGADAPHWRVIAYTYNHEDQAEHKVREVAAKDPSLKPEVFAPVARHAPYLVSLGGAMTREEAASFQQKAVSAGMPRDTYAQNYGEHGRRSRR